jgi:hypothetical protein
MIALGGAHTGHAASSRVGRVSVIVKARAITSKEQEHSARLRKVALSIWWKAFWVSEPKYSMCSTEPFSWHLAMAE